MEIDRIKIYNKKLNFVGIRIEIPKEVSPDNINMYSTKPFKFLD